jgi:LuxR family maltose regulon positive regulatory protein
MFRFAPFARELLRRELERRHATELPELRRTYAEWVLAHGRPITALRVAVDGGDLPLARRVVMASWYELVNHGMSVRGILGSIPMARLREEPLLVMLLAICYNGVRVRRVRGLQLFRIAVSAANSQRSDLNAADRLFIWVAESAALRVLGMHERAAAVAMRALRLLVDTPEDDKEVYAAQVPLLCAQLGISLYYGGRRQQAIECFEYGAALAAAGVHEHAISNLAMLGGIHALDGDLPEARHYVQLIRDGGWGPRYLDGYRGTFYRVAEAILALEDGDTERAAEHVTAFEAHRATSEHWLTMAVVEMLVSLRLDRPAMASARLESFAQLRGREGHGASARGALSRPRAILHLAQGNTEAAKAVLHKDAPEDRFETLVERARIALVDDRPRDTLRILSQRRAHPAVARVRAEAAALRTAALLRTGSEAAADQEARQLGALLDDREMRLPLALLPPMDAHAVWALLHDRALSVIEPVESALPHSMAQPALTERELIVLRALPSGKPLTAIATDLGVSPNTVKTQVKSVYRKLGVAGREEAVATAASRHLLTDHG